MALLCNLGIHSWQGKCICIHCGKQRDRNHTWTGCICKDCKSKRDQSHSWNGCTCNLCGKKRDEEHTWNGCICTTCGQVRDEGHDWKDGCQCVRCQTVFHEWTEEDDQRCRCLRCGAVKLHAWKEGTSETESGTYTEMGDRVTDDSTVEYIITRTTYVCQNCGASKIETDEWERRMG